MSEEAKDTEADVKHFQWDDGLPTKPHVDAQTEKGAHERIAAVGCRRASEDRAAEVCRWDEMKAKSW